MFPAVAWGAWVLWGQLPLVPFTFPGLEGGGQGSLVGVLIILYMFPVYLRCTTFLSNCTSYLRTRETRVLPTPCSVVPGLEAARATGGFSWPGCLHGPSRRLWRVLLRWSGSQRRGNMSRAEGKAGRAGGTRKHAFAWHLLAQRTLRQSRQASAGWTAATLKRPCFLLAKLILQLQLPMEGCVVTDKKLLMAEGPRASCPAPILVGFSHPSPQGNVLFEKQRE